MATESNITNAPLLAGETLSPLDQLCFTARHPDGRINLWEPKAIDGEWHDQCAAGRQLADKAIDYIRKSGDGAMLGGIVRTISSLCNRIRY